MPYSKKFIVSLVVVLIVGLTGIFRYSNNEDNAIKKMTQSLDSTPPNNSEQDQSIKQRLTPKETQINYNKEAQIEQNQDTDIPENFQVCKDKADMIKCIINLDTKIGETNPNHILQKENLTERLDSIDSFITDLQKTAPDSIKSITNLLEEKYLNQPDIVFEKINCQTSTCENIIDQTFKKIVDRYYARGQIQKTETCKKIQTTSIQDYCLDKLN